MTDSTGADRRARLARARLYLLLGAADAGPAGDALAIARAAVAGGVDLLQVRMKGAPRDAVVAFARALRAAVGPAPLLLVNDDVAAALAADADGVHLGQADGPVDAARDRLGPARLIGLSTHSAAEAAAARAAPVDYLGAGAMFATRTKDDTVPLGPAGLPALLAAAGGRPVFAIGGIDAGNVERVTAVGGGRIAVARALVVAADPAATARRLRAALEGVPT